MIIYQGETINLFEQLHLKSDVTTSLKPSYLKITYKDSLQNFRQTERSISNECYAPLNHILFGTNNT